MDVLTYLNGGAFHRYSLFGTNIFVHGKTGAIWQLDSASWDLLEGKEIPAPVREETASELAVMAKDAHEAEERFAREGTKYAQNMEEGPSFVKSLCLNVAHDCNLRCRYCFAGKGAFGGERGLMDSQVGKTAMDLLMAESGPRRNCEVDFFGGEPLLNWDLVKELTVYGEELASRHGKKIQFTLTTNGLLLDQEKMDFINKHQLGLILSIDGRPEVHNRMRPGVGGRGSHSKVLAKLKEAVASKADDNWWVRGTYTNYNLDFTEDVKYLVEAGFSNVSLEPVVTEEDYQLKREDLPRIKEEYERLATYYLQCQKERVPFSFFHFNFDLAKGPCLVKRLLGCGAGHAYLAVSPRGDLYPCHQFVGQDGYRVGTVFQGIQRRELGAEFRSAHILNKEKCRNCWAQLYCSGGCHANALAKNGDPMLPDELGCEIQRKRLECAIVIHVLSSVPAQIPA
jgi:uncharacterized protein